MITVFGSINLDQIGTVPRLPKPGETIAGGTFSMAAGGKGANQALAARRAGAEVRQFGAVGSDAFAGLALELLKAEGVDLSGVRVTPLATGIAMIFVDAHGENVIAVLPGANGAVSPSDADAALGGLGRGDVLLLQQEIPQQATERALDLAKAQGVVSVLNTAPLLPTTAAISTKAAILVANMSEFALLLGRETMALRSDMIARARDVGQTVIVTMGEYGVAVATPEDYFHVPALEITPVDTVGAGDTFCGYLGAGLSAHLALEDAVRRAATAASLACLKPGAQPAIPHAAEVDAELAQG
jgi:ribokinase